MYFITRQLSFFSERIRGVLQWQASNLYRVTTQWHMWGLNPQPSSFKAELFPLRHATLQHNLRCSWCSLSLSLCSRLLSPVLCRFNCLVVDRSVTNIACGVKQERPPTIWWDLAKRYVPPTLKCSNVSMSAILLTYKHRYIGISVVENWNRSHDFPTYICH